MQQTGVLVLHQAGANTEAVAEHVVSMLLSLSKNITLGDGPGVQV